MTTGVRWRETMDQLGALGITAAVEIGPGAVLSGLIKRSCPAIVSAQINSAADLGGADLGAADLDLASAP
jgi:[acyl-carrier-protein] S-malonyltransferase